MTGKVTKFIFKILYSKFNFFLLFYLQVMTTPLTISSMGPLITGTQYFSSAMMKPMTMMVSHQPGDSSVKNLSRGAN